MKNINRLFKLSALAYVYFLTLCFGFTTILAAENHTDVNDYIEELVRDAQAALGKPGGSTVERDAKCKELILSNLDMGWMAKYTLGRHRKELEPEKIQEFTEVYSKYVVKIYTNLIKNYKGERSKVKNILALDESDKEYTAKTEVVRSDGQPPIKVDYLVRKFSRVDKNGFKIVDIITEGVSMINSQKSEFDNLLGGSGGIDNLINALNAKL